MVRLQIIARRFPTIGVGATVRRGNAGPSLFLITQTWGKASIPNATLRFRGIPVRASMPGGVQATDESLAAAPIVYVGTDMTTPLSEKKKVAASLPVGGSEAPAATAPAASSSESAAVAEPSEPRLSILVGRERVIVGTLKEDWKLLGAATPERLKLVVPADKQPDSRTRFMPKTIAAAMKLAPPFDLRSELLLAIQQHASRCTIRRDRETKKADETSAKLAELAAARAAKKEKKAKA